MLLRLIKGNLAFVTLMTVTLGLPLAAPGNIIYDIVNNAPEQNGWTLSGTITTDGNVGIITASDITGVDLTMTNGATSYSTSQWGGLYIGSYDLTASATQLTLPDSAGLTINDPTSASQIYWNNGPGPANTLYFAHISNGTSLWSNSGTVTGFGDPTWVIANAETSATPEPTSMALMGLGISGFLVRRWRRRNLAVT